MSTVPPAVYVDHLASALGDETLSVEEAVGRGLTRSGVDVLRAAGFRQCHICRPETTAYDLARRACEAIRPALEGVGAIVYATCIPANHSIGDAEAARASRDVKPLMDFPASHLQADFGLGRAIVVGLAQQACTGLLGSLRLARALLVAEPELGRVLCLTSDRFPAGAQYEQSYNLISDGAAACVVSTAPAAFRLVACHQLTNGGLARASDDEVAGAYFAWTHRCVQETLARAGCTMRDIAWVVPQNMNAKAWEILGRILGVAPERVACPSLPDTAHLISGDNIVNLQRLVAADRVRRGDRCLLVMAGYGLNWQAVVLERT